MAAKRDMIPTERIERSILLIRGEKVILDAELAALYGTTTKALNQAVKRNAGRFPADFMFRLTSAEKAEVVTNCDHLERLKYSPALPNAFTEHGVLMAANVLNSERAVYMSVFIVRAFVRLRKVLATHADLARRIETLERKFTRKGKRHAEHIRRIYAILEALMSPPEDPKRKPIGYLTEMEQE